MRRNSIIVMALCPVFGTITLSFINISATVEREVC